MTEASKPVPTRAVLSTSNKPAKPKPSVEGPSEHVSWLDDADWARVLTVLKQTGL